jgi:hypothetical protein
VSHSKIENIFNEVMLDRGKFHRFHANIYIYMCVCVCVRARARAHAGAWGFFIVRQDSNFQTSLYTLLIQGVKSIRTNQLPTFHVFRKVHSMLVSEFSTVCHVVSWVLRMEMHNQKYHSEGT